MGKEKVVRREEGDLGKVSGLRGDGGEDSKEWRRKEWEDRERKRFKRDGRNKAQEITENEEDWSRKSADNKMKGWRKG